MDEKATNCCPNCGQQYSIKKPLELVSNIPLFIKCGHSMCECCVRKFVKLGKSIECQICLRTMEIKATDIAKVLQSKTQLYDLFPVNLSALGELTLQLLMEKSEKEKNNEENYFIDLQAILDSIETDHTQGQCLECHKETTKMCQQCATIICEDCFNKSHKNFVVFKNHVLQNIKPQMASNNCKVHCQKSLEYYCKDCTKSICTDCLMVGSERSCKSHNIVSTLEMNEIFLTELREILLEVDITFRRLTKTAVDIGHLLKNMDHNSVSPELERVTATINQHFSKLYAMVQSHQQEVMNNVARLRAIERESLLRTREQVASAIRETNKVSTALKSALDSENNRPANLSILLEEAKNIVNIPWSLAKDESNKDTIKPQGHFYKSESTSFHKRRPLLRRKPKETQQVCVSEELCLLVSDYVQLAGNAQARYALRSSRELPAVPPPPRAPVFPPALSNDPEMKKAATETVMSGAETKSFIELKEGVQEPACITYIKDPQEFYARRARDDPALTLIENQLSHSLGDVPRDIAVGKVYAVNFERSWKRCCVDAVEGDAGQLTYRVTCVDYGCTVTASVDELREIPSTLALGRQSRYPASLALRCRLANCVPRAGVWRVDDAGLLRRMLDKSPVLLFVRRAGAINECDVTWRGVSIAHALCFHGRAALVDPMLPYPESSSEEPARLRPANSRLRVMRGGDVLLSQVVSPGKFYVRESRVQQDYVKLCEELNFAYDIQDESGYIYLPKTDMVCVVYLDEQQHKEAGWFRAVVKSADSSDNCGVFLPDCGRQLAVSWHRLRAIQPRFTALKPLAIQCYLTGLMPRGGHWQPEASQLLDLRIGLNLRAVVYDDTKHGLGLVLLELSGGEPAVCLNQEMVDSGYADPTGSVNFRSLTSERSPQNEAKPQPPETPTMSETTSTNTSNVTTSTKDQQLPHGKKIIRLEAKILQCETPSLIYISLLHQQKTFNELFDDIQKFYMKRKTPRRENWKLNDKCCALCIQSQTWRRAKILETEKDHVTVFYTDFAHKETVPISHLKRLHSDFEVIGDAAIKCHLAGVVPATEVWPSLANEFLKDKLDEYKRIFVTKVGQFVETSMPVELWVYHTERGAALEPDQSEWRCLNAELLARGLAVPDPRYTSQTDNATSTSGEEELSFLNIRGPVNSWLLPLPPSSGSGSGSVAGEPSHWLPPEPLRAAELTAVPTYIDNDGIIFLHDVTQEDDLEFIRDTLEMAFKEPDPKAPYCTWRVGEPCVARYYLDGNFYRGTVTEVDAERSSCSVQYVDYGNVETCTFEDLRKRVALHQLPIQAHKCALSRIKPTTDRWSLDVLDYIHKAIVEKKCLIKVTGPAVDGVTPIDLKYDKLWFNDHLVEFDLAAYIDGSKPIERQFIKKHKHASSTPKTKENEEAVQSSIINIDSSSEPDYIVEEDIDSSQASGSPDSFKMRTLVDRDRAAAPAPAPASSPAPAPASSPAPAPAAVHYPRHEQRQFDCNVLVINDTDTLELSIIRDPEFDAPYEELFKTVKEEGAKMLPLDGIFEYKPCIALFEGAWYRASILKYSEAKNLMKVHYVDYGNIGIVPLSDVREINIDWVLFPPVCMTVSLYGVKVNPELHPEDVTKAYIDTFLEKGPFTAKVMDDKTVPLVELRNGNGQLVYETLIESNVFLRDTSIPM